MRHLLLQARLLDRLVAQPPKIRSSIRDVRIVALEEEIVRVAVGVGVHQDRRGSACHRGPRARSPGNTLPGCPAAPCGSRCGRPACRSPCRTRSSPPLLRACPARNSFLHPLAALRVEPGVIRPRRESRRSALRPALRPACASACRRWPGAGRRSSSSSRASAARCDGAIFDHLDARDCRGGTRG